LALNPDPYKSKGPAPARYAMQSRAPPASLRLVSTPAPSLPGRLVRIAWREFTQARGCAISCAGSNSKTSMAVRDFSPAFRAALVSREREINDIIAKLLESRPDSRRVKLRNIRSFVLSTRGTSARSSIPMRPERGPYSLSTSIESHSRQRGTTTCLRACGIC
jgi:hypothetical protein